jgi:glycosyltransferase involved in cell wall biosynthesis
MKVLIDALSARSGGGTTYMQYMPQALARQGAPIDFTVLLSHQYQSDIARSLPGEVSVVDADLPTSLPRRWWYLQTVLPRLLRQGRFDVLFAVAEGSYLRLPCPLVLLARNPSIYAELSLFGNQRWRLLLHRMMRQPLVIPSLWRAARVVCVSETFRREICEKTRIPVSKTQVVCHGLSPLFRAGEDSEHNNSTGDTLSLKYPFILSVSTVNPHKNYETLIRAFSQVVRLPQLSAYHLMIAGGIGVSSTYKMLLALIDELDLKDKVHFLGHIAHEDLVSYYRAARVFVFPSRLETFGHPLVEAMASGTPIVSSDLAVCREICQNAALYFAPQNDNRLASHVQSVLLNPDLRQELARRGLERSQIFSWDTAAQQMTEIFRQVAGK